MAVKPPSPAACGGIVLEFSLQCEKPLKTVVGFRVKLNVVFCSRAQLQGVVFEMRDKKQKGDHPAGIAQ